MCVLRTTQAWPLTLAKPTVIKMKNDKNSKLQTIIRIRKNNLKTILF